MVRVGGLSNVKAIFTDGPLEEKWRQLVESSGTELFIA